MRRLTDPQAHRERMKIIEGTYPEGMRARCAVCAEVRLVSDGKMVGIDEVHRGATRFFICDDCMTEIEAA